MKNQTLRTFGRGLGRSALLGATMLAGLAAATAPAFAQDADSAGEDEVIVITGSRIARQDYVADSPLVSVTGDQLVANADITLDTYLNTLPQVNPAGPWWAEALKLDLALAAELKLDVAQLVRRYQPARMDASEQKMWQEIVTPVLGYVPLRAHEEPPRNI